MKSGFPVEIEVINACMMKRIPMMPSMRYEYQGDLREIDVLAYLESASSSPKENQQYTSTELIIECKKSESKPWVFFSANLGHLLTMPQVGFVKYYSDFNAYFEKIGERSLLGQIAHKLKNNHYNDSTIPRCITYCEAFRDQNTRENNIYSAIESVLSFLSWDIDWRSESSDELGDFSTFYFPVIVLDGELLEAKQQGNGLSVRRRNHIQLRAIFDRGKVFIIDIVRKNHFATYLQMIEEDHKEFVSSIGKLTLKPAHRAKMKLHADHRFRVLAKQIPLSFPEAEMPQMPRRLVR